MDHHFLRGQVMHRTLLVEIVYTNDQISDYLTKPLQVSSFFVS